MDAILRGADHQQLGEVAVVEVSDDLAIALTRGLHAKAYHHTDANEDVIGVRQVGGRIAVIAADGHSGHQASHLAVPELDRLLGEDLLGLEGRQAPVRAMHQVNEAIRAHRASLGGEARRTRTTLTAAVIDTGASPRTVLTASVGDSAVIAISPTLGPRTLTRDRHWFMGDRCSVPEMAGATHLALTELDDDEVIVVTTDGLTNFARPDDIGLAVVGATAAAAARALIALAGDGGAGDNVAVAVLTPGD